HSDLGYPQRLQSSQGVARHDAADPEPARDLLLRAEEIARPQASGEQRSADFSNDLRRQRGGVPGKKAARADLTWGLQLHNRALLKDAKDDILNRPVPQVIGNSSLHRRSFCRSRGNGAELACLDDELLERGEVGLRVAAIGDRLKTGL